MCIRDRKNKKKPITCIIGGSKISTKINIIKNLIPKFENIIVVGAMANNLIKYKGFEIGKSKQENNCDQIIDVLMNNAGTNIREHFLKMRKQEMEKVVKINTIAALYFGNLVALNMVLTNNRKMKNLNLKFRKKK